MYLSSLLEHSLKADRGESKDEIWDVLPVDCEEKQLEQVSGVAHDR